MRLRTSLDFLTLIIAAVLFRSTFAIFSDEAYNLDFHHALVGVPQPHTTFLHRPALSSRAALLYTLSESGVLGAISPKDGSVIWRQRLGEAGTTARDLGQLKTSIGANVLASLFDGDLQVWDAADGRLLWRWRPHGSIKALEVIVTAEETSVVTTWHDEAQVSHVSSFSSEAGMLRWQHDDTSGDVPYSSVVGDGRLFYVSLQSVMLKGFKIKATELDLGTGTLKGKPHVFHSENEVTSTGSIIFAGAAGKSPIAVWSDKSFKTIKVGCLSMPQTTSLDISSAHGYKFEALNVLPFSHPSTHSRFLLQFQGATAHSAGIFDLDPSTGRVSLVFEVAKIDGVGRFALDAHASETFVVHVTSSEVILRLSTSPNPVQSWPLRANTDSKGHGSYPVLHIVAEVASRGTGRYSVRSILLMNNGDWEMLRNNESVWIKKEGLTGIVAAAFADVTTGGDFAQSTASESQLNFVSAYIHRVRKHWRSLHSLCLGLFSDRNLLGNAKWKRDDSSSQIKLSPDKFGYNKIIIVATKSGRLAALDTSQGGKVIWDIQAMSSSTNSVWQVSSIEVDTSTAVIHTHQGPNIRVKTESGEVLDRDATKNVSRGFSLSDQSGHREILSMGHDGSINSDQSITTEEGAIIVTKDKSNNLFGWTLSPERRATLIWTFQPLSNQKIRQTIHRPDHDPVASIGKVLGDRNVLYKYLSPNILLVTVQDEVAASVTIYLLDALAGTILYAIEHPNVDLNWPIPATLSENIFVYGFYSTGSSKDGSVVDDQHVSGYQLSVNELLESSLPNDRGSVPNLSRRDPAPQLSEGGSRPVHVISQSFMVPEPISQLSFTSTLQSISPRSLLCLTSNSGLIVSIPRYMLDPRRPAGRDPTSSEVEEGLFRYNSVLDFEPRWILNHKRESLGFSNVIAMPSLLESTSLIFAYGDLDIFGTRVSPIGGFDVLGKAFSKFQLVATLVALAVGTAILAPMVRKKQVDATWRT